MATYFGKCNSDGSLQAGATDTNSDATGTAMWFQYTCPGSGSQNISDHGVYVRSDSGVSGASMRMAVYNSAGNSLLASSGTITIATTEQWNTGTDMSATLTGGTSYTIVIYVRTGGSRGIDSTKFQFFVSGNYYGSASWDGGFPASLPTPDSGPSAGIYSMRVGVNAASAGSFPPDLAASPARRYYPQYVRSPRGLWMQDRKLRLPKKPLVATVRPKLPLAA